MKRQELYTEKKHWEELRDNSQYSLLLRELGATVRSLRSQIFALEVSEFRDVFELARLQGQVAGVLLARGYVEMRIDDLDADIAADIEAADAGKKGRNYAN